MIQDRVFILAKGRRICQLEIRRSVKVEKYLASGIYDITVIFNAFMVNSFAIGVFNGRIIGIDKMVLGVLDDKRGLSWRDFVDDGVCHAWKGTYRLNGSPKQQSFSSSKRRSSL